MSKGLQPIIIIGMHRSGTSMITKMLRELGLFIGWDINDEYEAMFFLNRNEKILNTCSGSWDNPNVIEKLLQLYELRRNVINTLYNELDSLWVSYYLGPKLFIKYRSIFHLNIPWGWKDPRNTFLLPLWLDIFPKAKIIHVYRNGLDIAQSLAVREEKRIKRLSNSHQSVNKIIECQLDQLNNKNILLFFVRKIQNRYRKLSALDKYNKFKIHPCISLKAGFELWCTYIKKAFEYVEKLQNEILNIKYEDFLIEPEHYLKEMQTFCSLPNNEDKIKSIVSTVNPERRFAFKQNESLKNFYENVKHNCWMCRLGYNNESIVEMH